MGGQGLQGWWGWGGGGFRLGGGPRRGGVETVTNYNRSDFCEKSHRSEKGEGGGG